mmetsp:Transcript_28970/g.67415  ORF Transcript_28970/g.67415 Transcript_28970/m.67415 type:complete len:209 (+) Transcript_28970:110-736(+)
MGSQKQARKATSQPPEPIVRADFRDFGICLVRPPKTSAEVGLELDVRPGGFFMKVKAVREGSLASAWNATQAADLRLSSGDLVISVNGVSGSQEEALDRLRNDRMLQITMRRGFLRRVASKPESATMKEVVVEAAECKAAATESMDVLVEEINDPVEENIKQHGKALERPIIVRKAVMKVKGEPMEEALKQASPRFSLFPWCCCSPDQ